MSESKIREKLTFFIKIFPKNRTYVINASGRKMLLSKSAVSIVKFSEYNHSKLKS